MTDDHSRARYEARAHAMQSGVAMLMPERHRDPIEEVETSPKHLRVGVNAAMSDHAALVGLLVAKGIITEAEYVDALIRQMQCEVDAYEARCQVRFGRPVKLA